MNFKNIIYLIFIIFLIILNFNESKIILKDLTDSSTFNQYADGNPLTCTYIITISVTWDNITNDLGNTGTTINPPTALYLNGLKFKTIINKPGQIINQYTLPIIKEDVNSPTSLFLEFIESNTQSVIDVENITINLKCSSPPEVPNINVVDFKFDRIDRLIGHFFISNWNKSNLIGLEIDPTCQLVCNSNCNLELEMKPYQNFYTVYLNSLNISTISICFRAINYPTIQFQIPFKIPINDYYGIDIQYFYTTNINYYPNNSKLILTTKDYYSYQEISITSNKVTPFLWSKEDTIQSIPISIINNAKLISQNGINQIWLISNFKSVNKIFKTLYWNNNQFKNIESSSLSPSFEIYNSSNVIPIVGISNNSLNIKTDNIRIGALDSTSYSFDGNVLINSTSLSFPLNIRIGPVNTKVFQLYFSFPFGCSKYDPLKTNISSSFNLLFSVIPVNIELSIGDYLVNTIISTPLNTPGPNLSRLTFKYLGFNKFLIVLEGTNFFFLTTDQSNYNILISISDYISGQPIKGIAVYSKIFTPPSLDFFKLPLYNYSSSNPMYPINFIAYDINLGQYLSDYQLNPFPLLNTPLKSPILSNFYFKISNMNTSFTGGWNTAYLNITNLNFDYLLYFHPSFILAPDSKVRNIHFNKSIPFNFDKSTGLFICDFYVPANIPTGLIDYEIVNNINIKWSSKFIKQSLGSSSSIDLMSNSISGYNLAPIIKSYSFQYDNVEIMGTSNINNVYFQFSLQDSINEFDYGYLSISSINQDNAKIYFNFTITSSGNLKQPNLYQVILYPTCQIATYEIVNLTLFDKQGYYSEYSRYSSVNNDFRNLAVAIDPFYKFIGSEPLKTFSTTCGKLPSSTIPSPSSPTIDYLITSNLVDVDVTQPNSQNLQISLSVSDIDGIMTKSQTPIIYLTGSLMDGVISYPLTYTGGNYPSFFFQTSLTLPYGFGIGHGIIYISVYGIVNTFGVIRGYNSKELASFSNSNIVSSINITQTSNPTLLKDVLPISNQGGLLTIFGNNLLTKSQIYIQYNGQSVIPVNIIDNLNDTITINVNPTNDPFIISLEQLQLNQIKVIPYIKTLIKEYIEPTTTPFITNPPISCSGIPICGGPSKGVCQSSGSCLCFSPWTGPSCESKVIIIPNPPISNPDNPTLNLTDTGSNNSNNETDLIGIISLISLREFDFNLVEIKNYLFDKWILTKLNENENIYHTSIIDKDDNNKFICNLTVSTIWYSNLTNIEFANQTLIIDASTLKYNINITSYPFKSKLNSLQLIMSATAQSTTNNNNNNLKQCSLITYGNTTNENYVKISLNDKSLQAKFIKRGIIDFKLLSIENSFLKENEIGISSSSSTGSGSNTYSISKSYIGINIPYYTFLAQLDPSFSKLLELNSVSNNDDGSICNYSNSSKLSTAVIIGIVIGIVGFAIISAILILIIIKKKHEIRHFKNKLIKLKRKKYDD